MPRTQRVKPRFFFNQLVKVKTLGLTGRIRVNRKREAHFYYDVKMDSLDETIEVLEDELELLKSS